MTNLDPAAWAQNVFPAAEPIDAGEAFGPHTFSTGDTMSPGDVPGRTELDS